MMEIVLVNNFEYHTVLRKHRVCRFTAATSKQYGVHMRNVHRMSWDRALKKRRQKCTLYVYGWWFLDIIQLNKENELELRLPVSYVYVISLPAT